MGPPLESTKEECHKILRRMELETYGAVVSTLRAQGELNKDRRKLLEDLSVLMKISPERHKAEIRRAVNDEKLGCIAERLCGADTEWAWALEGRRVVPLMPRLVVPTLFTSLATSVSKAVAQNPRICLNQTPISSNSDEALSKYVRDPDDEDTLSPVMVPIASPDSSCHSNNNFESDFMDIPIEKNVQINTTIDIEKKPEILSKKSVIPVHPTPIKRPRSPSNQVVNFPAPLSKVRAISPNCVRPQHKLIATPQPSPQLMPRGQVNTPVRSPQHLPSPPPVTASAGKIRVRAPIVQANAQRLPVTVRPPVSQYAQIQVNQTRPVTNNATAVKQVVQIRASSLNQQQQQALNTSKEAINIPRPVQSHTPVSVQTVPNVASNIGKQLPGKANVIVLHKNLPMTAKSIATVAREVDRSGPLNKKNFLSNSVTTPAGTKVTFPSNVRIISVPSGTNVVSSCAVSINHNSIAQKNVSTAGTGAPTQKNVYVLELSNEAASKSIILGDVMPNSLVSDVNGVASKTTGSVVTHTKTSNEGKFEISNCVETNDNGLKTAASESVSVSRSFDFSFPSRESIEKNGEHIIVHTVSQLGEDTGGGITCPKMESSILDSQTGEIYNTTDELTPQPTLEQSSVDIFSTAIASADINMEAAAYGSDDNAGTRLILTDTYDTAKS